VEDFELENGLAEQKKQRLNEISRDCRETLNELQRTLDKHQVIQPGTGTKVLDAPRRVWKRLRWDQEEISQVQAQIHRNIGVFSLFLSGLTRYASQFLPASGANSVKSSCYNHDGAGLPDKPTTGTTSSAGDHRMANTD
jgi:hypothetical protein